MKKAILTITSILYTFSLFSQYPVNSFQTYAYENNLSKQGYELGDMIESSILTAKGELVYVVSYNSFFSSYPSSLNWLYEVLDGNTFIIKKRNKDLEVVGELNRKDIDLNGLFSCQINGLFEQDSGYRAVGIGFSDTNIDSVKYFIADLNHDLQIQNISIIPPPYINLYAKFRAIGQLNGNIILLGFPRDTTLAGHRKDWRIFIEMTENGGLERVIDSLPSPETYRSSLLGISMMPNGSNFIIPNILVDSNSIISYLAKARIAFSEKVQIGADGNPIVSGVGEHVGPNQFRYSEQVLKLRENNQVDTMFFNIIKNEGLDNHCISGLRNFSVNDHNRNYCAFAVEEFSFFDNNYVHVICFDSEGNMVWEHYCGGDANYVPLDVYTLNDGVLFTFLKYYTNDNNIRLLDVVYAKFDENGIISQLSESIVTENVNLYPNPSNNIVYIDLKDVQERIQFCLYDSTGKLLICEKQGAGVNSFTASLNKLEHGLYFYQIKTQNRIIESGKLVKN